MTVRKRLLELSVAAAALLLSLAAGEAVLRAVVPLPLRRVQPEVRYANHPVRRFTLQPNQSAYSYGAPVAIDADGFRGNGATPAAADAFRILALGDSFTFGMGVPNNATWPARLESVLRERTGRAVGVVNAGTISYGVFQELDLMKERGLATKPQLVVHGLYWNDFMNAAPPPAGARPVVTPDGYLAWDRPPDTRGSFRRVVSWALSRSALLFTIRQAVTQASGSAQAGGTSEYARAYGRFLDRGLSEGEWKILESFYEELLALGSKHNFSVHVVVMPVEDIVNRPAAAQHPYASEARRRLARLGITYLDGFTVWTELVGSKYFLTQGADAHLNADGYRILADRLAEQLLSTHAIGQQAP